jgi:hypothetical protein
LRAAKLLERFPVTHLPAGTGTPLYTAHSLFPPEPPADGTSHFLGCN